MACGRLALMTAVIMGAWYTDAQSFISAGRTSGCQYEVLARQSKFRLAVSDDLNKRCPSVVLLMRAIAEVPGSTCELYSVSNLTKQYRQQQRKQQGKKVAASAAKWVILSVEREEINIDKENRVLYWTVSEFIRLNSKANTAAMCPGYS